MILLGSRHLCCIFKCCGCCSHGESHNYSSENLSSIPDSLHSYFSATYAEALSTSCKTCPAGYSCPENKRTQICPFDGALGYFYSTDSSESTLNKYSIVIPSICITLFMLHAVLVELTGFCLWPNWLTYRNVTSHELHSQGVHGNPISNSQLWHHHAQKGFSKNIYNVQCT